MDHVLLEGGHEELRASALHACDWIDVRLGEHRYLVGDALAIQWIKSAVKLIEDVEWKGLNALDSEDEAGCNDSFLAS